MGDEEDAVPVFFPEPLGPSPEPLCRILHTFTSSWSGVPAVLTCPFQPVMVCRLRTALEPAIAHLTERRVLDRFFTVWGRDDRCCPVGAPEIAAVYRIEPFSPENIACPAGLTLPSLAQSRVPLTCDGPVLVVLCLTVPYQYQFHPTSSPIQPAECGRWKTIYRHERAK